MKLDFHSHILPEMDDGSRDVSVSLSMLLEEARQGVTRVLVTPHFYPWRESPDSFLARREESMVRLQAQWTENLPEITPGAEVAFFSGLGRNETIRRLCIGSTRLLLVEMPFDRWPESVCRDLLRLPHELGIVPVLAHVERYVKWVDLSQLSDLSEAGCMIQCNAELFEENPHLAKKILKKVGVDFLGTDAHNMESRRPNMEAAETWLRKNNPEALERITAMADSFENDGKKEG